MDTPHKKGTIVIVDDTPDNLRLLTQLLNDRGYKTRPIPNGKRALVAIQKAPPDLILLDIMMPGMNGYEVCQKLKADERAQGIPIIFLSALSEANDKVKAFSMGGVDYITKPFQEEEVLARVETHLALKHAHDEIADQERRLEKQNQELMEAARLQEDVERITQHDLKTPLNLVIGYPQMLMENRHLTDEEREYLKGIEAAGYQMLLMINSSLDLLKIERGMYQFQPDLVDILEVFKRIAAETHYLAQNRGVALKVFLNGHPASDEDTFFVLGEDLLCYSMLGNLIKNAIEASSEGEQVTVSFDGSDAAVIRIHNNGAVPEDIRDRFFEKYVTSGKDMRGTGLGTYSAKLMAETQHGIIRMTSSDQEGTAVTIRLPTGANAEIAEDALYVWKA